MLYEAYFISVEEVSSQSKLHGNKACHTPCRQELYRALLPRALLMWFLLCQFRGLDWHQDG